MIYEFPQLPTEVASIANAFLNITVEGKSFPCPYYINRGKKFSHPSLAGKGTPEQITDLITSTAHSLNFDLTTASADDIRKFMVENDIGIDCSGLVVHLLNAFLKSQGKESLIKYLAPPHGIYKRFVSKIRPYSNISADRLTSAENCDIIEIKDAKSGTLIRSKRVSKGSHILMVTYVQRENGRVQWIEYINSTSKYGMANGVRLGRINILDENKPLHKQEWTDNDEDGKNPILEGIKFKAEDNGLRKFKALN